MTEPFKQVRPARSLMHSLLIKARIDDGDFYRIDPASGLVEIPEIVWAEFAAAVEQSPLLRRV